MESRSVVIERVLNAPVAAVWKAISDVKEMRKWYFELEDFRPEPGFKFTFTGCADEGVAYKHLCEVLESVKEKRLTHSWTYDGYPGSSLVTWELEKQGDKTLLRLTHSGIGSFAANGVNFSSKSFTEGWTGFADALNAYLEN